MEQRGGRDREGVYSGEGPKESRIKESRRKESGNKKKQRERIRIALQETREKRENRATRENRKRERLPFWNVVGLKRKETSENT